MEAATPDTAGESPANMRCDFPAASGTSVRLINTIAEVNEHAGLWPIALTRSTSSLVLGGLALTFTGRQPSGIRQLLPAGVAIGTLEAGGIIALLLALQRGPVSIASVLLSLYPVTTVLLATIVLGERMSRTQLAGVALALSSVVLISAP